MSRTSFRAVRPRQAVFFLLAIVLPCSLLVVLTTRMLVQERELGDKRRADEQRRLAADVRQDLLARVERIRLGAVRGDDGGTQPRELALVARVETDRLILPWEGDAAATAAADTLEEAGFRDAIRAGERKEFIDGQFPQAAAAYRNAVAGARSPAQRAAAQLLLGRVLSKSGRHADADAAYRAVLEGSARDVDDQGIPFTLYAARRLLDRPDVDEVTGNNVAAAVAAVLASPVLRPATGYMARDIVTTLQKSAADRVRERGRSLEIELAAQTADIEQALELQKAFPVLMATPRSGASEPGQRWMPFGPATHRWLVNVSDGPAGSVLVAVRAGPVLTDVLAASPLASAGVTHPALSTAGDGEPLLPDFPGLSIIIPAAAVAVLAQAGVAQRPLYIAALAVVLSTALFGAYLFWRDVEREIRLAELRSQFVSSVSHELKTPLTAIRMFAETLLLGRSPRPEVSQEYLETIVNESERLTRLLNNVLDFSKIEQGTKTYRLTPQSAPAMVRTAVSAMQYPLAQQGFELRVHISENVPTLAADADGIQQALLNLLSNAMKYSGEGRVIELDLTQRDGHAVIAVTDRGIGIAASEHKRIFEKFYRVPGIDNQRIAGTGLGLTLVDHVARAHGGRVTVTSEPGAGSTFALVLPLSDGGAGPVAEAVAAV
jgi:signal transduction histidine kinase